MARPKGSKNNKEEKVVEETETKEEEEEIDSPKGEQFDPSLPESKQRHLR